MSQTNQPERRDLSSAPKATGRTISGYACLFNVRSQNLAGPEAPLYEIVKPGAFDNVLKDDVRALLNHDASQILARSKAGVGTLKLTVDAKGLFYQFTAPDTQVGNDLVQNLRLGNLDQSSYSFTVDPSGQKYTTEGKSTIRTITRFSKLFDVSPVTYPATTETSVSARSKTNGKPIDPVVAAWQRRLDLMK